MKDPKKKAATVTVSFRCPRQVHLAVRERIGEEGIDFSKFVRRALRKELRGVIRGDSFDRP